MLLLDQLITLKIFQSIAFAEKCVLFCIRVKCAGWRGGWGDMTHLPVKSNLPGRFSARYHSENVRIIFSQS